MLKWAHSVIIVWASLYCYHTIISSEKMIIEWSPCYVTPLSSSSPFSVMKLPKSGTRSHSLIIINISQRRATPFTRPLHHGRKGWSHIRGGTTHCSGNINVQSPYRGLYLTACGHKAHYLTKVHVNESKGVTITTIRQFMYHP